MGWYAFISLMSDGRVKFLLGFIIVAIIVASVLIFIEIKLKRKKENEHVNTINKVIIERIIEFLKSNKTPKEKLDFIDKFAKEYFKEHYDISINSDYSKLIREFKKLNKKNEEVFSEKMFSVYYLYKKINSNEVIVLGNLLVDIIRNSENINLKNNISFSTEKDKILLDRKKDVSQKKNDLVFNAKSLEQETTISIGEKMNNFLGKIIEFFNNRKRIVVERKQSGVERTLIRRRENYKILRKNKEKIRDWAEGAIKIGHDREYIFNLLNDGNRKKEEINNILNIYDEEMSKISSSNKNTKEKVIVEENEGIAEKIIKKEKARLDSVGLYTTKF